MTWLNRLLLAGLLAGLVAYAPSELEAIHAPDDLERVTEERDELREGNARLREELRLLEAEVGALHSDVDASGSREVMRREIERIAREDLNMVRPGEIVFEFVPPRSASSGAKESSR
ncbi:MAG: FtsB family cell division protein [Nannocystaceae bacterium]